MGIPTQVTRRSFLKASLATATASSVFMLAACGGSDSGAGDKVTLKYWDYYVTQGPWVDEEIKLFKEKNPNIDVKKTTHVYDKYTQLFTIAAKGGSLPDAFQLPAVAFEDMVKQKWLLPISDFSDYKDFTSAYPNPEINFVKGSNISLADNKTYSAPFEGPSPGITFWVNTKVFKDAGLVDSSGNVQIPKTLDEVLTASRTIKEKSGGNVYGYGFGGKLPYHDIWLWSIAELSSGGSRGGFNQITGKHDHADNPVYAKSLEWLATMRKEKHILPDSASVDDEGIRFRFAQHKFGMLLAGIWVINGWKETNPEFKEYTMSHAPLIDTTTPKGAYYAGPGGSNFGISAKTKQKDAAWKWFQWLHSPAAGERWVKSGNGISVYPTALKSEYATNEAMKNHFELAKNLVKYAPAASIRNPDVNKVQGPAVKPSGDEIVKGVFTGQITNFAATLKDLQTKNKQSLEQGIKDAQSAGYKVTWDDYVFPDWDPTKDYVTKAKA